MGWPIKVNPFYIMKININKNKLAPALKNVSRAALSKISLPVLTGIKFEATEDGKLTLTATDLEMTISCTVEADVKEPGSVVLPSATVVNLIEKVPSGDLVIEGHEAGATIRYGKTGRSTSELKGFPASEFPELPEITTDIKFSVSGKVLTDIASRVFYAASDDITKGCMSGVNFEIEDGKLVLAATDSYRLAVGELSLDGVSHKTSVVIPKKAVEEVCRLFRTAKDLAVQISENRVSFISEGLTLIANTIAGNFPNYKAIVLDNFKATAKVNSFEFIKALERVSVLKDTENPIVSLKVNNGLIELKSKSALGSAREEVEAVTKKTITIYFNANYLITALKNTATGDGDVLIGFTEVISPAMIKPAVDNNISSIVLPVRMREAQEDTAA